MSRFFGLQERQGRFWENKDEIYKRGMILYQRYMDLAKHAVRLEILDK